MHLPESAVCTYCRLVFALLLQADKVDAYLHQLLTKVEPSRHHLACFGNWVLYHTLHVMINYALAGFELELYAVHEYHYVFWSVRLCIGKLVVKALLPNRSPGHRLPMWKV